MKFMLQVLLKSFGIGVGITASALAFQYIIIYFRTTTSKSDNNSKQSSNSLKKLQLTKNIVEICVSDINSVEYCRDYDIDSIELCTDRNIGGITPCLGLIEESAHILQNSNIKVHVLLRPRAGHFNYNFREFDVIIRDIVAVKQAGADGIVVGFLDDDGNIDKQKLSIIRKLSEGMILTFNRAFDLCTNPVEALESLIEAGYDRLLTSGRAESAGSNEGIEGLKKICGQANGRIQVIAAGGINHRNVDEILSFTGVNGVHIGSSVHTLKQHSTLLHPSAESTVKIGLGLNEQLDSWLEVDSDLIKTLMDSVKGATGVNSTSWRSIDNTPRSTSLTTPVNTERSVWSSISLKKIPMEIQDEVEPSNEEISNEIEENSVHNLPVVRGIISRDLDGYIEVLDETHSEVSSNRSTF